MIRLVPVSTLSVPGWIRDAANAINQLIRQFGNVGRSASYSANFSVTDNDYLMLVDASASGVTVALPAAQLGRTLIAKKVDSSGNAVTLNPVGAETIDGAGSLATSTQYETLRLLGIAGGWAVI